MIEHAIGTNTITVNGEVKSFGKASFSENSVSYLPTDMMQAALRTNAVSFFGEQININKPFNSNTDDGKAVNDALYARTYGNFYPEKFKRYINYHIKKPEMSIQNGKLSENVV